MDRARAHRHHTAALRVADGHLGVLEREQDKGDRGHADEERGVQAHLAIEDAGHVVDGGADVGEDHGPAQERAQPGAAMAVLVRSLARQVCLRRRTVWLAHSSSSLHNLVPSLHR